MKDGFVKVMARAPEIRVADCVYNAESIAKCMQDAEEAGVEILVLPELCVTGYTCGDLFLQRTLIDGAADAIGKLLSASEKMSLITVVGAPFLSEGNLYNCAFVIQKGALLGIVPKSNIPNYGEFCESRYFTMAPQMMREVSFCGMTCPFGCDLLFSAEEHEEFTFAIELCEDLLGATQPSSVHARAGASII